MAGTASIAQYSIFGSYDLAVAKWCRGVVERVDDTSSMPVVMASPQRAFGEARKVVERNTAPGRAPTNGSDTRITKVPLPLISITRGGFEPREGRMFPFHAAFRGWLTSTDDSQRLVYQSKPPVPYFLDYQIDIWSKTINVQSQLVSEFLKEFDPHMGYGMVKPHENWGPFLMPIKWGGMSDNSELEGADSEDRLIRNTLSIRIEAWMFFGISKALTALTTTIDETSSGMDIMRLRNKQYRGIYIPSAENFWFKVYSTHRGIIDILPVDPPKDVTKDQLMSKQLVLLEEGVILAESSIRHYHLGWDSDIEGVVSHYAPTRDDITEDHLIIPKTCNLLIGSAKKGSLLYGQLRIGSTGAALTKERAVIV